MRSLRFQGFLAILAGGLWVATPGPVAAQDMMTACATEIGQYCSSVSSGRGRILACLIGHDDRLSATCKTDVTATAQRGSRNPLVPSGVRKMMGGDVTVSVPAACSADVGRFCAGITPGANRTIACLYANTNEISGDCASQVRSALN